MGFLDAKERIFDVVLTDKGKELLSQNLLNVEFYAFSDEGLDYGAALTASLNTSGSVDEHMRRTPMMEATQFKDFNGEKDFSTFLYSVPAGRQTLPIFTTNFDDRPDITSKRLYYIDLLVLTATKNSTIEDPISVVMRGTVPKDDAKSKEAAYATEQQVKDTKERMAEGKSVVGHVIGKDQVMLVDDQVLNTSSGLVQSLLASQVNNQPDEVAISVEKEIEVVTGLSRAKINMVLKSSEGEVDDPAGYLIEVFESGSNGEIVRLFEENVEDVLEDEVLKRGFEKDFFIDVDATSEDLISEERRLARREERRRESEFRRLEKRLEDKLK